MFKTLINELKRYNDLKEKELDLRILGPFEYQETSPQMKKTNKKRNPVAKQLRHFKRKVIKSKRIYDRKNNKISY